MNKTKENKDFKKFKIPEPFFKKFYEFTGTEDESSRGFIIAYVNQEGFPLVYTKVGSPIIEMGLIKALESYLEDDTQDQDQNNETSR